MNENRIRVKVEPQLTPTRLEDKMDLNAEIKVDVDSHLTGLGIFGITAIAIGVLSLLGGSILFSTGYPDTYHGCNGTCIAESHSFIETVVLLCGAGIVLLFFGTSAFFYGRTVLGSGRLDQFTTQEIEVQEVA